MGSAFFAGPAVAAQMAVEIGEIKSTRSSISAPVGPAVWPVQ
jgi:hypothetical protein